MNDLDEWELPKVKPIGEITEGLVWSDADQRMAQREGWFIGKHSGTILVSQASMFWNQDEAHAHVTEQADDGSAFHQRALTVVAALQVMRN